MYKVFLKIKVILLLILLIGYADTGHLSAEENIITVYYNKDIGQINKKVFGNNFVGYEPELPEKRYYYGRADYGLGIWNPKDNKPVEEVINLAKEAGISIVRFAADYYNWKDAISKGRKHFLYGIDEFLRTVKEIGAEPFFTISYFIGNEQDAADLVEYLNAPCDGKHPWADKRAENGHPEPYGVKYFELGNEVWTGDHRKRITGEVIKGDLLTGKKWQIHDFPGVFAEENDGTLEINFKEAKEFNYYHSVKEVKIEPNTYYKLSGYIKTDNLVGKGVCLEIIDGRGWNKTMSASATKTINRTTEWQYVEVIYKTLHDAESVSIRARRIGYEGPLKGRAFFKDVKLEKYIPSREEIEIEKSITPEGYAEKYLSYQEKMKKIDPSIQLGVILHPRNNWWNHGVLEKIGNKVDFVVVHIYPPQDPGLYSRVGAKELFKVSLGPSIAEVEKFFSNTLTLIKQKTGKDDVYFAVNEYNGGFVQEKPLPYRHSLGTALINAELLRIFMKPEHRVLMANNWHFANNYWGMIKSEGDFMRHDYRKPINYIKRPNYYVYELYHNHFGDVLVATDVKSGEYKVKDIHTPYLSVNASKDKKGDKIYLMVINKNMDEAITSLIELKNFLPSEKANAWILNGPSIDAINEKKTDNVKITHKEFEIKDNPFKFTFEPHSLTAIEIERIE